MDVMMLGALLLGMAIGAGFGWLRGRQLLAGAVSRSVYDGEVAARTTLQADLKHVQARMSELNASLDAGSRELLEARERIHASRAQTQVLEQRLLDQKEAADQMQERLKLEFQALSTKMLEEMSARFNTQSEKKIGDLLTPMQQKLTDFQKLVTDSFTQQGKEQHSLRDVIAKIVLQTDSLSRALRGDVKAQGNWGEIMLERILEASGLEKGVGYTTQGSDMGLTDAQGHAQRPDVIVHLPDSKHIIVDSKVSLVAYERFCAESDEAVRGAHLKDFLRSVQQHVAGLAGKNYPDIKGLETPDIVLLFMPIEGAYSLAVQHDQGLHSGAWNRRVAIVSPSTLFITLKTVASLWKIEKQNKHSEEIARRGAQLYDKFAGFVDDMLSIKKALDAAQSRYDSAMNKLHTGQGNLVRQAEMMKELGLKTGKSMPASLSASDDGSPPALMAAEG